MAVTAGVRVSVEPRYAPEGSDPDHANPRQRRFAFIYRILITNEGTAPARLLRRRWVIVNARGESHEVAGDGVVGEQPRLEPGESHEYESWVPLDTAWGTMEGSYTFARDDGGELQAEVGRFYLVAPAPEAAPSAGGRG